MSCLCYVTFSIDCPQKIGKDRETRGNQTLQYSDNRLVLRKRPFKSLVN
jgi:hypothetical protein